MKKLGLKLGFMTLVALVSSCDGYMDFTEVDYPALVEAQTKENYKTAFEAMYGPVSAYQSWDFSDFEKHLATRAGETITTEIVPGIDFSANGGTVTKNTAIYNDIKNKLPDGQQHTGQKVVLAAPGNPFYIYPISAQGGYKYEFYVKVGDLQATQVFTKDWGDASKPYCNTMYCQGTAGNGQSTTTTETIGTWDGKLYIIRNVNNTNYYLNGNSAGTSNSSKYAIIKDKTGKKHLYSLASNVYLKMSVTGGLSTTTEISEASEVDYSNNGTLKIGGYYLYVNSKKLNTTPVTVSNKSHWTWTEAQVTNNERTKVQSLLTKTTTTLGKDYVYMPGIKIDAPAGTSIQIYVKITAGGGSTPNGTIVGTATSNVIYVDLASNIKPEGIPLHEDAVIKYMGLEDQKNYGDKDYNDLVLAVVGEPNVPQEIVIDREGYDLPIDRGKRYMIEDLGTTDDFDFNDIVVDVVERTTTHYDITITNGVAGKPVEGQKTVKKYAIIRHLGGTLAWRLLIDGKDITGRRFGVMDVDPNEEIELPADVNWNPSTNNIAIKVEQINGINSGVTNYDDETGESTVTFPELGQVPMMIATPLTKKWMGERETINWGPFENYLTSQEPATESEQQ